MAYKNITVDKEDKIAILWFNQPDIRNAWSPDMGSEFISALEELNADPEVNVVILTGKGEAFSAGAYLKDEGTHRVVPQTLHDSMNAYLESITKIPFGIPFPKPMIAAINGYAIGMGLVVALCCDILIASENARMSMPECSLGVTPGYGAPLRLAQFVGKGKAMEMLLTAKLIDAQEAFQSGLVVQVTSPAELMPAARKIAARVASFAPIGVKVAKQSLNEAFDIWNVNAVSRADVFRQLLTYQTEDAKEAHQAWRDKRKPDFKGK